MEALREWLDSRTSARAKFATGRAFVAAFQRARGRTAGAPGSEDERRLLQSVAGRAERFGLSATRGKATTAGPDWDALGLAPGARAAAKAAQAALHALAQAGKGKRVGADDVRSPRGSSFDESRRRRRPRRGDESRRRRGRDVASPR